MGVEDLPKRGDLFRMNDLMDWGDVANGLTEGVIRFGAIFDGDESTPEVQGALELQGARIVLTLPWPAHDSPYTGWFGLGGESLEIGEYRVPGTLMFHDNKGSVILAGCRGAGFNSVLFGPGTGRIEADMAVFGPEHLLDFSRANGVVTTLSGLRGWLGISTVSTEESFQQGLLKTSLNALDREAITLGDTADFQFEPRHWVEPPEASHETQWIIHDVVYVRATCRSLVDLNALLARPRALRDLLMLSRWQVEEMKLHSISRNDDPLLTMDGKEHGPDWREAVLRGQLERDPVPKDRDHLYRYHDLEAAGILRWFDLRESFSRAIDPVLATLEMQGVTPGARLAQAGPGLEALGYLLFIRDGLAPSATNSKSLQARLERLLDDIGEVVPFEISNWAETFARVYNGIKHANRTLPDEVELLRAWRDAVNAVRAWVGMELGVDASQLQIRLQHDWLAKREWVKRAR